MDYIITAAKAAAIYALAIKRQEEHDKDLEFKRIMHKIFDSADSYSLDGFAILWRCDTSENSLNRLKDLGYKISEFPTRKDLWKVEWS